MVLERRYDPALDRASLEGCLNDAVLAGHGTYALAVSTTSAVLGPIPAGIYRVFLDGLDPLRAVVLTTGDARVVAERPASGREGVRTSAVMPGNATERLRVLRGRQHVAALVTQGTGTLYLVPLVVT
jgi:hypothetical protein